MTSKIRTATAVDIGAAQRLITALGYGNLSPEAFKASYDAVLSHPEMTVLVAEATDGEIVGLASVSHRPQLRLGGQLVSLDEFVVAPEARGKGVGARLIEEVKAIAERLGAVRLELEQNRNRESYSRSFYSKNGFTEVNSAVLRIDLARHD
jgi:GNAT superfamily N-acetyltransferase